MGREGGTERERERDNSYRIGKRDLWRMQLHRNKKQTLMLWKFQVPVSAMASSPVPSCSGLTLQGCQEDGMVGNSPAFKVFAEGSENPGRQTFCIKLKVQTLKFLNGYRQSSVLGHKDLAHMRAFYCLGKSKKTNFHWTGAKDGEQTTLSGHTNFSLCNKENQRSANEHTLGSSPACQWLSLGSVAVSALCHSFPAVFF